MRQYDRVKATFTPVRTGDLKPEAVAAIGTTGWFTAGWIVESEDGGPYVGQWAMMPAYESWKEGLFHGIGWVPLCDLTILIDEDGGVAWLKAAVGPDLSQPNHLHRPRIREPGDAADDAEFDNVMAVRPTIIVSPCPKCASTVQRIVTPSGTYEGPHEIVCQGCGYSRPSAPPPETVHVKPAAPEGVTMTETIVFDRVLTSEERLRVENYVLGKYGIDPENPSKGGEHEPVPGDSEVPGSVRDKDPGGGDK